MVRPEQSRKVTDRLPFRVRRRSLSRPIPEHATASGSKYGSKRSSDVRSGYSLGSSELAYSHVRNQRADQAQQCLMLGMERLVGESAEMGHAMRSDNAGSCFDLRVPTHRPAASGHLTRATTGTVTGGYSPIANLKHDYYLFQA